MLAIRLCLWPWLTQANIGQIQQIPAADSKTVPGFDNWPWFVRVTKYQTLLISTV